jgi:hypothetical protein
MAIQLDAAFIDEWGPKFEARGIGAEYEGEYPGIVKAVALEIKSSGTLSKELFLRIWNWKGAMRVIRHIRIKEYPSLYAPAFRRAVNEPPARKLLALLGEGQKLPGVGAPTGSTILHFIHPEYMPIIDIRTVETLYEAGRIKTKMRDLDHYEEFRAAINRIKKDSKSNRQASRQGPLCVPQNGTRPKRRPPTLRDVIWQCKFLP